MLDDTFNFLLFIILLLIWQVNTTHLVTTFKKYSQAIHRNKINIIYIYVDDTSHKNKAKKKSK